jgi:hypothetical protein
MFNLLLQNFVKLILEINEVIEDVAKNLGGLTPKGVNGILIIKEKDVYLADFLLGILELSEYWTIKDDGSFYARVQDIRKCQRCRIVIGSTSVNEENKKDISDALDALIIKKAIVKHVSVFALEDNRLKKGGFTVVVPGG